MGNSLIKKKTADGKVICDMGLFGTWSERERDIVFSVLMGANHPEESDDPTEFLGQHQAVLDYGELHLEGESTDVFIAFCEAYAAHHKIGERQMNGIVSHFIKAYNEDDDLANGEDRYVQLGDGPWRVRVPTRKHMQEAFAEIRKKPVG